MLLYIMLPALVLLTGTLIIAAAFLTTPNPKVVLEKRLSLVTTLPAQQGGVATEQLKRQTSKFDRQVRAIFTVGVTYRWGMHSGGLKLLAVALVTGLAVWLFTIRAVGLAWWLSVAAGVFAAFLAPRLLLLREQGKAEGQFRDLLPDAVDSIVRMLRAGLPMTTAVRAVGVEGAPPVSTAFAMIADQIKLGITIEEALEAASEQIGLDDFRFFAVAVLLQYSTGGNIAATLEMLSTIIRKRRAMRLKAQSATAEIRLTAYVLGSLPVLTTCVLLMLQPGYLRPMFADPRGHVILGMAAAGLLLSYLTMRQMMRSVTKV